MFLNNFKTIEQEFAEKLSQSESDNLNLQLIQSIYFLRGNSRFALFTYTDDVNNYFNQLMCLFDHLNNFINML